MRVILLGAGASKAYSDSPTGVRMPIACDFFDTFDKLKISENPWALQDGVLGFIQRVYDKEPYQYLRSGIDIEDFHSDIEDKLKESIEKAGKGPDEYLKFLNHKAFNQLIYIFASVINEIQNGPVSKPHTALAKLLNPDDVVITFNWDTLMDRALRQEQNWSTDNGYGFEAHKIYRNQWVKPEMEVNVRAPRLIKLHGSTNWLTSHQVFHGDDVVFTHTSSPDDVWIYESTIDPYECHAGRYMEGYTDFSYGYYPVNLDGDGISPPDGYVLAKVTPKSPWMPEGLSGKKGLVSIPLIVPPVKEKKYDAYGDLFHMLWDDALQALIEADEIVIIGYSFPRTDLRSNKLFIDAFMARDTMPKLKILDPFPEKIADKFKYELGIIDSKIFVCKEYFDENFDLVNFLDK
ncbi:MULTISPECIES: SIR2 family protein [Vibrio]|uniref:SIR2 family protein n=1 Tax=Vibrio TaxID=662 RepID=UPI00062FA679|nr:MULTISPECIES: SIR2 family protein [Vibrio]OCH44294.1 hypothetical protein A6E07_20255 [Vibrio cyclitrophicus]TCO04507.1 SIR2-like protein [Vibrio crassostreae]CAK1918064.1 SIR2-like domain-containing protein [Vibrio crassostreae]CAK1979033.1 SIR2-like domain-containing protein [Vibrio crassostreae]CAK2022399.1 SIR2-like domain-containing protein [Vibrio crassostreae]